MCWRRNILDLLHFEQQLCCLFMWVVWIPIDFLGLHITFQIAMKKYKSINWNYSVITSKCFLKRKKDISTQYIWKMSKVENILLSVIPTVSNPRCKILWGLWHLHMGWQTWRAGTLREAGQQGLEWWCAVPCQTTPQHGRPVHGEAILGSQYFGLSQPQGKQISVDLSFP